MDLLRALLGRHPAVKVSRLFDPALWPWGIRFLRECTDGAYRRNSERLLRISRYSAQLLRDIGEREGIEYHLTDTGALYLYHDAREFELRRRNLENTAATEGMFEVLGADQLLQRDPALAGVRQTLAGGLLSKGDLSGDCHLFTTRLAEKLRQSGRVNFRYCTEVSGIERGNGRIEGLRTSAGDIPCTALVVAAGNYTPALLAPLGARPLIYPVKGYSATYPVLDSDKVPRYPAIDETALVSYARYGDRLRMTAVAEFAGNNRDLRPERLRALDDYARKLCGDGVDTAGAEYWTGLRPSTPGSTPYLGRVAAYDNLFVNAGHGQLGWTMSAGSGALVADHVSGAAPELSGVSTEASWLRSV